MPLRRAGGEAAPPDQPYVQPLWGGRVKSVPVTKAHAFDWKNFVTRAVSAMVLAGAALFAVWVFPLRPPVWRAPFLILIAIGGVLLSMEWADMATPRAGALAKLVTAVAVLVVILLAFLDNFAAAWIVILSGALLAAWVAGRAGDMARDGAYGLLYIAPACMVLVWLIATPQGRGWALMLFACTWSADILAFMTGNLLGGPKLWPRYSPNKTWSGFFGGLAGATMAAVAMAALFMRLSLAGAALIGFLGGLATMGGDLWESMLKRRFGVKDSGDLIPGHGGLMDRVDGMMFAVMVFAVARLVVRFGWAH
jgi:phosphatidate cytidylyltransferase